MELSHHLPSPPLASSIEHLWALRDEPRHASERIVPNGSLELVINLEADAIGILDRDRGARRQLSGAIVSGAHHQYFAFDTRAHASIIGVHFHRGAAGAVLGVPAGALADTHVDLEDLWGRSARELREQLCEATTTARRFAILDRALRDRLGGRQRGPHAATPFALARLGRAAVRVGHVAAEARLSSRRFIEVFTADVGITPKRFSRIVRFQHVLACARRTNKPDWAALAIDAGYFDQSHLINECRELTGMSPVELMAASALVKTGHAAERSNTSKP
jgi:AraC-like DNA-binding protein